MFVNQFNIYLLSCNNNCLIVKLFETSMTSSLETEVHNNNVNVHNVVSFYSQKKTIVIFERFGYVFIGCNMLHLLYRNIYFFLICAQHMLKCFNMVPGNLIFFFPFFFDVCVSLYPSSPNSSYAVHRLTEQKPRVIKCHNTHISLSYHWIVKWCCTTSSFP